MNLSFWSRLNAVALLFLVPGVFGLFNAALASGNQTIPPAIQKQLQLSEEKIDIGIAALTFAKEFYPHLDIAAYSKRIDLIVDKARQLARGTEDPETRIRILNTVIHQMEGFHYDRSPFARSRQDYYFLNGILDTKQGICYSLPLLYIAVAQRLGYPLYPVLAPDHIFVRYVIPNFTEQNIETTSGGKYFPDQYYIEAFAVSQRGLKSGSYMRTLTYRQFLGHMLAASAVFHGRNATTPKTIAYLEKAAQLDPQFAGHYDNLRIVYSDMSEVAPPGLATVYREKAEQYARKAQERGFVDPANIKREQEIRGKS
jgi:regulator of sirC expression with transglutaminase-like and TPR domain